MFGTQGASYSIRGPGNGAGAPENRGKDLSTEPAQNHGIANPEKHLRQECLANEPRRERRLSQTVGSTARHVASLAHPRTLDLAQTSTVAPACSTTYI